MQSASFDSDCKAWLDRNNQIPEQQQQETHFEARKRQKLDNSQQRVLDALLDLNHPLSSDFLSESHSNNGVDSDASIFWNNSFAQNPTPPYLLSSSYGLESLDYSSTDSRFGYATSSSSTSSLSSSPAFLPSPLSAARKVPSHVTSASPHFQPPKNPNASMPNSQYCPISILPHKPQNIPYSNINTHPRINNLSVDPVKDPLRQFHSSSRNRPRRSRQTEQFAKEVNHGRASTSPAPLGQPSQQKHNRRPHFNSSKKTQSHRSKSPKPIASKRADSDEFYGRTKTVGRSPSAQHNLYSSMRLKAPQPGVRRNVVLKKKPATPFNVVSQNAKAENAATNNNGESGPSCQPEDVCGDHQKHRKGNKSIPGIMAGVAIVQRWIRGGPRQKDAERRLSLASTSASTDSSIDDWSIAEELLDKGCEATQVDTVADNASQANQTVLNQHRENVTSSVESELQKPGHYENWQSFDSVSVKITKEETSWTEYKSDMKNERSTQHHQYLNPMPGPLEVFQPLRHVPHHVHQQDHHNGFNEKNEKDVTTGKQKSPSHAIVQDEIQRPRHDDEEYRELQRPNRSGNGVQHQQQEYSKLANGNNQNIRTRSLKTINDQQLPGVPIPTAQRIYTTASVCDYPHNDRQHNSHHHNYLKQHSNNTNDNIAPSCLVKYTGRDGHHPHEIWACQHRGEFTPFLESSDFEVHLARNFLRAVYRPPYERFAEHIVYRTLRMLRSCRYPLADILQCVALALCHIRRATSKIYMGNSIEAAYVGALQIFLAHAWLLDETCPLKEWYKHIFIEMCSKPSLNEAVMTLFKVQEYSLSVKPDIVHLAVHELAVPSTREYIKAGTSSSSLWLPNQPTY